jgi:hypothetical protein
MAEFPEPEPLIDNAAPAGMRLELIDQVYALSERPQTGKPIEVYVILNHTLGVGAPGNPMDGRRQRAGRNLAEVQDWRRVYDVVARFATEFRRIGLFAEYRESVNRVFAAYGVVWRLDENGRLIRIVPTPLNAQLEAAFYELARPGFESAMQLFNAARDAFNDHPMRARDACGNVFDAMEATGKIVYALPTGTFGDVLAAARGELNRWMYETLQRLNTLRNNVFGHGTTVPFSLLSAETEFVYFSCIAGIVLFARLRRT